MFSWYTAFKRGLARQMPEDPLARAGAGTAGKDILHGLENLRPFVRRHLRSGLLGSGLVLLTALLGFPFPLLTRYLVDEVILERAIVEIQRKDHSLDPAGQRYHSRISNWIRKDPCLPPPCV